MKGFKAGIVLALVLGLFAGAAFAAEPIRIGLLAPLTGPAAADGMSVLNSVKIAVDQVNKAGGVKGRKITLSVYDDRIDAKEAVSLAYKLIEKDKVHAVVGGSYSMPTRAVARSSRRKRFPWWLPTPPTRT